MEQHEFSKSAFLVAGYRARATACGQSICHDPWARSLAGDIGRELSEQYDQVMPDTELWISLRTRHIDDCVRAAVASGIRQIVVMGAGFDTRAARMAQEGVRFFEVDRPASQAAKRRGLAELAGYPADAATYVACDFQKDDFVELLEEAGIERDQPACFVLEGLVYYLQEDEVRQTLRKIASSFASSSWVVFDYFDRDLSVESSSAEVRFNNVAVVEFLSEVGEEVTFGVEDPRPMLADCGFRFSRTVSFAKLALRHTGEYDNVMGFHRQWIAIASPGHRVDNLLLTR